MKTLSSLCSALVLVLCVSSIFLLGGCGPASQPLAASPSAQGATGTVQRRYDESGTHLAVHVRNLVPPSKVAPDATTYVVWVKTKDGMPHNLGTLQLKGEEGSFEGTTRLTDFQLFITAEPVGTTTNPWGDEILSIDIHRDQS